MSIDPTSEEKTLLEKLDGDKLLRQLSQQVNEELGGKARELKGHDWTMRVSEVAARCETMKRLADLLGGRIRRRACVVYRVSRAPEGSHTHETYLMEWFEFIVLPSGQEAFESLPVPWCNLAQLRRSDTLEQVTDASSAVRAAMVRLGLPEEEVEFGGQNW